jgi:hypothetical protein
MRVTVTMVASLLLIAAPALAEPAKDSPSKPAQPQQSAQILLASAEALPAPAERTKAQPAPEKHRVAPRITTCRCGDPQVVEERPKR